MKKRKQKLYVSSDAVNYFFKALKLQITMNLNLEKIIHRKLYFGEQ